MAPTDAVLLERWIRSRDADAFAEIVSRHAGMVYGTCKRILGNAADGEDVAQECFVALAQCGQGIRISLGGWLHTTAVHRSINRIRADRRRKKRESYYAERMPDRAEIDWDDLRESIDEAIAELPEELRALTVARFLEGRTHDDLAREFGLPRSTVRSRLEKGIARIRTGLRRRGLEVSAPALSGLMATHTTEAAPLSLVARMGAFALAGEGSTTAAAPMQWAGRVGELTVRKALVAGLGVAIVAVLAALPYAGSRLSHESNPEVAKEFAAEPPLVSSAAEEVPAQASAPVQPLEVPVPEAATAAEPPVASAATVSGQVLASEGYPVPGARVRVEVSRDPYGYDTAGAYEAVTDSAGRYTVSGIEAQGPACAYVSAKGFAAGRQAGLQIAAGRELRVDFMLSKGQFSVSGQVVNTGGQPVADAAVQLRQFGYVDSAHEGRNTIWANLAAVWTDAAGRFELAVEIPGKCDLSVIKVGYGPGFYPAIPTDTHDARLVLAEAGAIEGRVTSPNGKPAVGMPVEILGNGRDDEDPTRPQEGQAQSACVEVVTDGNGRYRFENLGETYLYTVRVKSAPAPAPTDGEDWAARAVAGMERLNGSPSLAQRKNVAVQPGRTIKVDLVLAPVTRIRGHVTDSSSGIPVYPLGIRAFLNVSGEPQGEQAGWTSTAPDGFYELLLPLEQAAEVRLYGIYIHPGGAGNNASEPASAVVKMDPGSERELDFTIDAPVTVPVRVVEERGTPVSNVQLLLANVGGRGAKGGAEPTDAEGRSVWPGIPPEQEFVLTAIDPSREGASRILGSTAPFSGTPGETLPEQVIVCKPKGGVEGVATDAAGQALVRQPLGITAVSESGVEITVAFTDEDGRFTVPWAFPAGRYSRVIATTENGGQLSQGEAGSLEVRQDAVADLGTIVLSAIPETSQESDE